MLIQVAYESNDQITNFSKVHVEITARKSSNQIILHALTLNISYVQIDGFDILGVGFDHRQETFLIIINKPIDQGNKVRVEIGFQGMAKSTGLSGLYRR